MLIDRRPSGDRVKDNGEAKMIQHMQLLPRAVPQAFWTTGREDFLGPVCRVKLTEIEAGVATSMDITAEAKTKEEAALLMRYMIGVYMITMFPSIYTCETTWPIHYTWRQTQISDNFMATKFY